MAGVDQWSEYRPPYVLPLETHLVRAALTAQGRNYLARAARDGTGILPVRFTLGSGSNISPPGIASAEDSTETSDVVFSGRVDTGDMVIESANAKTLVVACYSPVGVIYDVQEIMIYAQVTRCLVPGETYREFPFACTLFPNWYYTTTQRFVARIVIPLG